MFEIVDRLMLQLVDYMMLLVVVVVVVLVALAAAAGGCLVQYIQIVDSGSNSHLLVDVDSSVVVGC